MPKYVTVDGIHFFDHSKGPKALTSVMNQGGSVPLRMSKEMTQTLDGWTESILSMSVHVKILLDWMDDTAKQGSKAFDYQMELYARLLGYFVRD